MATIEQTSLARMSVAEKIQLVEDIWDSIVEHPEDLPVTKAQKAELDRRLKAHQRNPRAGAPWATVRARLK